MLLRICTILLLLTSAAQAADWHINPMIGSDDNEGTAEAPFATIQKAVDTYSAGDTIHLHPEGAVYRQGVLINGKSDLTIEGNDVTLDGSDPLPTDGWETIEPDLFRRKLPRAKWERHLLIQNGKMERMGRTQASNAPDFPAAADLKLGEFRFENIDEQEGWLYVRGNVKNLTWSTRINGLATGGKCRNITVRNLNTRYFLNDGFNVHGDTQGLKCENITGYDCFDEGFSAHDTCVCEVVGGKFWGNENGIADVNSAITVYHDSEFRDNFHTDVLLAGLSHRMVNCRIINSTKAAAMVAGPRTKDQGFELTLEKFSISTENKTEPARVRINGGKLQITDSNFANTAFIPLGAELKAQNLKVNGADYLP